MTPDFYHKPRKTNDSKIAQARMKKGWTQQQLADAVGVNRSRIAEWERGVYRVKLETAVNIANALSIDIKELL